MYNKTTQYQHTTPFTVHLPY